MVQYIINIHMGSVELLMGYSSEGMILTALSMCGQKGTLHSVECIVVELFQRACFKTCCDLSTVGCTCWECASGYLI